MRTKEEILEQSVDDLHWESDVHDAMDEYARQTAIGFAEWMRDFVYDSYSAEQLGYTEEEANQLRVNDWLILNKDLSHTILKSTSDLYSKYLETLKM